MLLVTDKLLHVKSWKGIVMSDVSVSVVIPCLNEEETLLGCIEAAQRGIEKAGISGEIIVSDNGSTDRSIEIAEKAGARVVHCKIKGYGNALRAGFEAARGDWIIMGDADQSYDFEEIPRFWEKINEGYELVMGSRLKGEIKKGAMPPLHQYVGNPLLSGLVRLFFKTPVSDSHCGLRAFTRDGLARMDLRTTGMELASEIVIKSALNGLKTAEIPITLYPDARKRAPHLRSFRDGWRHLRYILMMAPNWLFMFPGAVSVTLGSAVIALLLPRPLVINGITFDVHTMLLGMALVLLGVYLLLLGTFVKAFTYTENLAPVRKGFASWLRHVKLEHGLIAALVLIGAGFAGDLRFFINWSSSGFGDVAVEQGMRWAIFFTTILIVGIEVFFASFFLSMLGISRDHYVGDYTREN